MQSVNLMFWVVVAIAVVLLVVLVGGAVWLARSARERRAHEARLRGLGLGAAASSREGAPPFAPADPAGANDTVPVSPLSSLDLDYERLAAEPVLPPPAVPLGRPVAPEPFSWTAAVSDPRSEEIPTVDPSHLPSPSPGPAAEDWTSEPAEDLDRTTVVRRPATPRWELVLPDGSVRPLASDTVVGRSPTAPDGAFALEIPDATRTLSKVHARLRRADDGWIVEDLGSTNGVVLLHGDGREQELEPGQPVTATPRLLLGTLEVEIRESSGAAR